MNEQELTRDNAQGNPESEIPYHMNAVELKEYSENFSQALQYTERHITPNPLSLKSNQMLIKLKASSVNPVDWKIAQGSLRYIFPMNLPCILGRDGVGTVLATGSDVSKFKKGDEVFGFSANSGMFAGYAVVQESDVARKPPEMKSIDAACMPLVSLTAFQCFLKIPGGIRPDSNVFINGASGGVGSWAVILAKHFYNVRKIFATCSLENKEYVTSLGADVVIDYKHETFEQVISNNSESQSQHENSQRSSQSEVNKVIDVCIDTVGGDEMMERIASVMKISGTVVTVGAPSEMLSSLFGTMKYFAKMGWKKLKSFFRYYPSVYSVVTVPNGEQLQLLTTWSAGHNNIHERILVKDIFTLKEVPLAFERSKKNKGKYAISIS